MSQISSKNWLSECGSSQEVVLVDVRTPFEFNSLHAKGAVNLPLDQFSADSVKALAGKKRIGLICQSGSRAKQAFEKCRTLENKIEIIEGGTQAWHQAGCPVNEGKKVMSLERQVRIAAGALVLSGVVLSKLVMPGLEYLSAFVGAGLIFAGITDTCGMGMLIAKMPWNQKNCSASSSCSR
jgi:rhodanese-related sulfurtransferase